MVGRVLTASLYALGLGLYYLGVASLVRRFGRKNPKILLYHDCAPTETVYTAELHCTTSPDTFRAHIDYLKKHYKFVDVETIAEGRAPDGAIAITFDDGYSSVYEHAFPVLKEANVPATIYLISSVVDNATLVWVNELNFFLRKAGPEALACTRKHFAISGSEKVDEVISHCRLNYRPEQMGALLGELRELMKRPVAEHAAEASLYLSWDQIAEMSEREITFGNHSRTHPNMERLTEEEQRAEIIGAQVDLKKHLSSIQSFAHPFGHKGDSTVTLVMNAGIACAADVGGYNVPVMAQSLGRTHLSEETVAGMFARMEVVEPMKGKLRQLIGAG